VQLSPSSSLEDKEYKDEKEKKRTEEISHLTPLGLSLPDYSDSKLDPLQLCYFCVAESIFRHSPSQEKKKKKGTPDILAKHPSVPLLIGSTGKPAFRPSAKTIKHAVARISADTVGCWDSRDFRSSPNFSVSYYLTPDPVIDDLQGFFFFFFDNSRFNSLIINTNQGPKGMSCLLSFASVRPRVVWCGLWTAHVLGRPESNDGSSGG
jgi:hypothetical protein